MANPGQRYGCYVGNIDSSVPLETVRQVFSQCGTIMDCSLNGRDTDPYRFGFIDFAQEADRERALKFNGVVLAGRPLKVGVSKGNVNRPNPAEMAQQRGDASVAAGTLLAQLIQSGALNPANLTAEQQQQLSGALLSQLSGGGSMGMPSQMAPLAPPPMMGMPGGYGMQPPQHMMRPQHSGGYVPGQRSGMRPPPPSANPPPSAETMALREAQRKTFFDVVRKEADKYQEKLQRKKGKRDASGSDSDGSSSSSDDEDNSRRRRKESSSDRKRERSSDRDRKEDSHSNSDQRNAL